jgi:Ca-activated chloride channel family protein
MTFVRRLALVLAVLGLLLGIGDRDEAAPQALPMLDVLVVVDRTTSMSALDDPSGSRITAVRRDLVELGDRLATAQIAVATFGRNASIVLPFSSDRATFDEVVSALQVEPPAVGTGSSVSRAVPLLTDELERAAERSTVLGVPRVPVVVLLSDGERTSPETQASFRPVGKEIGAGVVLGYGTARGAVMPLERVDPTEEPPTPATVGAVVTVPGTDTPAVSRLDPDNLDRIADELGTPYVQRDGSTDLADVVEQIEDTAYADLEPGEPERERRWVWAIAVLVLVLPELRSGWRDYVDARRRSR